MPAETRVLPTTDDGRFPLLDRIKAAAILAVVVNHVLRLFGPTATSLDQGLRWVVQFHVPGFLLVSGFLFGLAQGRTRGTLLATRLRRVVVPYVIASLVLIRLGFSGAPGLHDALTMLLTGSALGIYYYVFVLVTSLLLATVMVNVPRAWLWTLAVVLAACMIASGFFPQWVYPRSLFWQVRSPAKYYGYFLIGWLLAARRDQLLALFAQRSRALLVLCGAGLCIYAGLHIGVPDIGRRFQEMWRLIYTFSVVGLIAWVFAERPVSRPTQFFSRASLTIYLYHVPFVWTFGPLVEGAPAFVRITVLALVGTSGAAAVALLVRRLTPRWSRELVGY